MFYRILGKYTYTGRRNRNCNTVKRKNIRGVLISWVVADHENNEIKTPRIFCRFTVYDRIFY